MPPTVTEPGAMAQEFTRRRLLTGLATAMTMVAVPMSATRSATVSAAGAACAPPGTAAGVFGCGWHRARQRFVLISAGPGAMPAPLTDLPERGHDVVAHPARPLLCVIARRPGNWALIVDRSDGRILHRIAAPAGRHFYGHGVFDADGMLHLAENDFLNDQGIISHYRADNYERQGETPSGGIGPHEILSGRRDGTLVVANGGILTRPETGRAKLNLDRMQPNLSLVDWRTGAVQQLYRPAMGKQKLSVRHIARATDGSVAIGMQYQGDKRRPVPLVVVVTVDGAEMVLRLNDDDVRAARAYIGAVALSADGKLVAASAPRAGRVHFWERATGRRLNSVVARDVCGLAPGFDADSMLISSGAGLLRHMRPATGDVLSSANSADLQWDNHLLRI